MNEFNKQILKHQRKLQKRMKKLNKQRKGFWSWFWRVFE